MDTRMKLSKQVLAAAAAVGIAAAGGSAFTASNIQSNNNVGQKTSTSSGYTVTAVTYTFSADGTNVTQLEFDAAAIGTVTNATYAKVKLSSSDTWHNCVLTDLTGTPVAGTQHATCDYSGAAIATATVDQLNTVIVGGATATGLS
jgi:uncharacterized cupredoxin-like copper-binding protein